MCQLLFIHHRIFEIRVDEQQVHFRNGNGRHASKRNRWGQLYCGSELCAPANFFHSIKSLLGFLDHLSHDNKLTLKTAIKHILCADSLWPPWFRNGLHENVLMQSSQAKRVHFILPFECWLSVQAFGGVTYACNNR